MNEKIVVFGAGGHAKVMLATIGATWRYQIVGCLSDREEEWGRFVMGYEVLGGREKVPELRAQGINYAAVAIGDNAARREVAAYFWGEHFWLPWVAHPTAILLSGALVDWGTVLLPYSFIGADVRIGQDCIIGVGSGLGHDSQIGQACHIACGVRLGGHVTVGDGCLVGMNAVLLPGVTLGAGARVGAGAVVTKDVAAGATVVGVPAR